MRRHKEIKVNPGVKQIGIKRGCLKMSGQPLFSAPCKANNLTVQVRYGGLLEQILSPTNMNQAKKRVKINNGSGGIDKMEVESLRDYLVTHKDELTQSIHYWLGELFKIGRYEDTFN